MIRTKLNIILLLIWPVVLAFCLLLLLLQKPLIIDKNNSFFKTLSISTTNDSLNGGASKISLDTSQNISFEYALSKKIQFPYALFNISNSKNTYLDLSDYNQVEIKIRAKKGRRVPFILLTKEPNFTKESDLSTFFHTRSLMQLSSNWTVIKIPFDDLETPTWWFTNNHKTEKDNLAKDFSKVKHIAISSCANLITGEKDKIEIEYIQFSKDGFWVYVWIAIAFLGFITTYMISKPKKRHTIKDTLLDKPVIIQEGNKIAEVEILSKDENKVLDYIQQNFSNQDLSLSDIQQKIGISERKITAIIKDKRNLSFKQYLNFLRIEESKKLLKNADLNISEIAYQIGFANVSHFNRVFKTYEKIAPSDFRNNTK